MVTEEMMMTLDEYDGILSYAVDDKAHAFIARHLAACNKFASRQSEQVRDAFAASEGPNLAWDIVIFALLSKISCEHRREYGLAYAALVVAASRHHTGGTYDLRDKFALPCTDLPMEASLADIVVFTMLNIMPY
jgi:hypothetical protein